MIQNIEKGRGFRGALNYVLEKPGAELIGGTMAGETPRQLAAEFRSLRAMRPDVRQPVFHASLSAPVGERLTEDRWVDLAHAYAERMGFGESAYVVVRHRDRDHDHVHVVASRVDAYGRIVSDRWERYRGQEVLRALEREYGLTAVAPSWEVPHKQLTKAEIQQARQGARDRAQSFIEEARQHAARAFGQATSWENLEHELAEHGLRIEPKRNGLVVTDGVEEVKASAVGRVYTRTRLEERFGMAYADWIEQREQRAPTQALATEQVRGPVDERAELREPGFEQHPGEHPAEHPGERGAPDRIDQIRRPLAELEERERLEAARAKATERALRTERELTTLAAPRDRALGALPELAERAEDYLAADLALRAARARVEELTTRLHAARAESHDLDEALRALPSRSALLRELSTLAHDVEQHSPDDMRRLEQALSPPHRALLREATARAKELERARERDDELER